MNRLWVQREETRTTSLAQDAQLKITFIIKANKDLKNAKHLLSGM